MSSGKLSLCSVAFSSNLINPIGSDFSVRQIDRSERLAVYLELNLPELLIRNRKWFGGKNEVTITGKIRDFKS